MNVNFSADWQEYYRNRLPISNIRTPILRYSETKSNMQSKVRNLNYDIEIHDGSEKILIHMYISNNTIMQYCMAGVRSGMSEYRWEYRSTGVPFPPWKIDKNK